MTWTIDITDKALKSLAKLDHKQILKIKQFLDVDLPVMVNPRLTGKAL
jgi:mRNA-degrading endonuclease RelE of RelBE toxin-antitoxin system